MARRQPVEPIRPPDDWEAADIDLDEEGSEARAIGDLADLDAPDFQDWEWTIYRLRTPAEQQRGVKGLRVWIGKKTGPIDLAEIQGQFGGGWFEFWGKVGGVLRRKYRREIEGEPIVVKRADASLPPAERTLSREPFPRRRSPAVRMVRAMRREMLASQERLERELRESRDRFERLLETILGRPAPMPPAAPSITDVVGAVRGIHELAGPVKVRDGLDTVEMAKLMLDQFHQGVVIGQAREPTTAEGRDPNDYLPIVEKGLEILATMIQRGRRPGQPVPRPAGVAGERPASEATVVEPAPRAENPDHRWRTAIEAVYRGMLNGKEPGNIADSLEDILNDEEIRGLRGDAGNPPDATAVLAYLETLVAGYPSLTAPQGVVYLNAVLAALREPAEG